MLFKRKVQHGDKLGRKLGYPTLNFRPGSFGEHFTAGVYSCLLKIQGENYKGALYFGPKFSHKGNVLEVFIIDYTGDLYGKTVSFSVGKRIRGPKKFDSLKTLKEQIQTDVKNIRSPKL